MSGLFNIQCYCYVVSDSCSSIVHIVHGTHTSAQYKRCGHNVLTMWSRNGLTNYHHPAYAHLHELLPRRHELFICILISILFQLRYNSVDRSCQYVHYMSLSYVSSHHNPLSFICDISLQCTSVLHNNKQYSADCAVQCPLSALYTAAHPAPAPDPQFAGDTTSGHNCRSVDIGDI